jgi:EVE domain
MTRKFWIGVAAANHVARGHAGGFMQVNHGKQAPLKRVSPGDVVAYYSPVQEFGGKHALQAFTAIGVVREGEPYQGDMGSGFTPFRRDVDWMTAQAAPIAPLLQQLSFTRGQKSWGYKFRFGFFEVAEADMKVIAEAMGCNWLVWKD